LAAVDRVIPRGHRAGEFGRLKQACALEHQEAAADVGGVRRDDQMEPHLPCRSGRWQRQGLRLDHDSLGTFGDKRHLEHCPAGVVAAYLVVRESCLDGERAGGVSRPDVHHDDVLAAGSERVPARVPTGSLDNLCLEAPDLGVERSAGEHRLLDLHHGRLV